MVMPRCADSLSTSFLTDSGGTMSSWSPCTIRPEAGQGARNEKSNMLAGGATDTKPVIYGRRISSCRPNQAPKEKPANQTYRAFGLEVCRQTNQVAASGSPPAAPV